MPKPSNAACEREERIAEVQLKTFWTCFPLITSTIDESCRSEAKESLGHAEAAAPEELCSRGRKQLLARLRTSIIEKDQAKRRKVDEMLTMQANSNTGSDQADDIWGIIDAVMNDDPF